MTYTRSLISLVAKGCSSGMARWQDNRLRNCFRRSLVCVAPYFIRLSTSIPWHTFIVLRAYTDAKHPLGVERCAYLYTLYFAVWYTATIFVWITPSFIAWLRRTTESSQNEKTDSQFSERLRRLTSSRPAPHHCCAGVLRTDKLRPLQYRTFHLSACVLFSIHWRLLHLICDFTQQALPWNTHTKEKFLSQYNVRFRKASSVFVHNKISSFIICFWVLKVNLYTGCHLLVVDC